MDKTDSSKEKATAQAARMKELADRQAKRDQEREERRAAFELEELELNDKYSEEIGRRGSDFEIVDLSDPWESGFIVLQRGATVLHKKFRAAVEKAKEGIPETAMKDYVQPCVLHPDLATFRELVEKFPAIWYRCADAMATLHGARRKQEEGKF